MIKEKLNGMSKNVLQGHEAKSVFPIHYIAYSFEGYVRLQFTKRQNYF